MHLERIEMIGFKSFADRSVFSFQPGVTAIIGPNGCGKSNIVDAFRWVLGEQSAKNMRGDRMEDVIFTGSEVRKPTGMAEVTLFVKDVNGQLPQGLSEYDEISITRRLYRSGESEYLINKVPCRLKDIRDLFLDTGLEAKSYSIIEQGKIDQILNSKPIDRRFLIEEAAGVMKYKARRAEATQKLELASQNLLRIRDITGEVERQINSLHRQVKKAERYNRLKEEIKGLEVRVLSIDYKNLGAELSEVNGRLEKVTEDLTRGRAKISKVEIDIEGKRIRLLDLEKEIQTLQERLLLAEKAVGQKEKDISLLKSDISSMNERADKNEKEIKILRNEEKNLKEELRRIEEEGRALEEDIESKKEDILRKEDMFSVGEDEISRLEEAIEEAKKALFEKAGHISDARNRIMHLETLKEGLSKKKNTAEVEINEITLELAEKDETLRRGLEAIEGVKKEREDLEQDRRRTFEEIQDNERNLSIKEEEFLKKKEFLTERGARLSSLKEVEASLDGYHEEIKALLMEKGLNIHGLVADILETSPEYELAIEAALGQRLQYIVLQDHETILKTIDQLKAGNSGRGTFIPLEPRVIKSEPINMNENKGVIGEAVSLVRCRNGYQKVVEALLGDTVIVTDLSTALKLWNSNGPGTNSGQKTLVTLEGDVIAPLGAVSGGSPSINGGGILRKKREIKELEEEVRALKEELDLIEQGSITISKDLEALKGKEQDQRLKIEGLDKDVLRVEKDIAILQADRDRLLKRIEILRLEDEEMEKEEKGQERELSKWSEDLKAIHKEKEILEGKIKVLDEELKEKRDDFEDLRSELMDLKLDIATLSEKKEGNIKEKERLMASKGKGEERILALRKDLEWINQRVLDSENRIKEIEGALASILKERAHDSELMVKLKDTQTEIYGEIEIMQEALKKDREGLESIQTEEGELEVKRAELTVKIEHIIQSLRNNYNLSIEDLNSKAETRDEEQQTETRDQRQETSNDKNSSLATRHSPLLEKEVAEEKLAYLKERLEALGAVNLAAIEEYKELKERYDFLMAQQTDLLQSIDSLKEAIEKIDSTTKQRLRDAFRLLNERFQEVFRTLFEGGKAELILDGGDILNSGIDIIAQPPGKKLQNLSLLSGGEKALASIALLFASFLVKPSPLCLLDEVDAPLDDTNIDKFTSILKSLTDRSQFVVITHNRRTMEAADILYGITMEEPGITKVLSVRLNGDNGDKESQMAMEHH